MDAAKILGDKTSAAFCVPKLNIEYSVRLTDNISVFAAELTAIKLALLWVINTVKEDICIFSDSYSSLQAISSGKSISRPKRFGLLILLPDDIVSIGLTNDHS